MAAQLAKLAPQVMSPLQLCEAQIVRPLIYAQSMKPVGEQLGLALPAPRQRGGRRKGAGRKRAAGSRDPQHRERARMTARTPVHAVLRVTREVGRLRKNEILAALRHALEVVGARRDVFRIVHYSLQHNHLHLLVEASGTVELARGMQAFAISAARAMNRAVGRTGRVFEHRYHSTMVGTPRQARNVLAYVLGNWRRHNEDERSRAARFDAIDRYSSAAVFPGWLSPTGGQPSSGGEEHHPLPVSPPRTWLLSTGWTKAGPPLDPWATPGPVPR